MDFEQNTQEKLPLNPALQTIADMELKFSDEEFMQKSIEGDADSKELSEEAFIKNMKYLIDGTASADTFGTVLNILERESMQGHPQMETFKQAIKDLAEQNEHDLDLPEEYWDKLK